MHVPDDGPLTVIPLPGGATCTILSPSRARLEKLEAKWTSGNRGDEATLDELFERLADDTDETDADRGSGTARPFGRDSSVANGSSLAFLFEQGGVRLLLTGDAFASELHASISRLLEDRQQQRLDVDLLKLSHHGSRNNITDELLDLVSPAQILVCTDGSRFEHPDEDALDLVRRHYPKVPIHFTDDTPLIRQRAERVGIELAKSGPLTISF